MKSLNKASLIGNFGHTPELKENRNGTPYLKNTLATNRNYKGEEQTTWHNLVFFGKLAEIVAQYASKGDTIYVEGRIDNSRYENKDGQMVNKSEIIVEDAVLLGKRDKVQDDSEALSREIARKFSGTAVAAPPEPEFNDEIPF
jgi:single-strand DNA-binding protein